jgi:ParB/RepB/Spo0J family partition protein
MGMGMRAIPATPAPIQSRGDADMDVTTVEGRLEWIPVVNIEPSPYNTRQNYTGEAFEGLKASIKEKGVLNPPLVRPLKEKGRFQLVAGERRWRAATAVELPQIQCMVKDLDEREAMECTIVENLQREDLTEIEEAKGFKKYLDEFGPESIDALAQGVGKLAQYIRRRVRVLELPDPVLELWKAGELTYSHLELLIRLDDPAKASAFAKDFVRRTTLDYGRTVPGLKNLINQHTPALKTAKFPVKGCGQCPKNSTRQAELYGFEAGKGKEIVCFDAGCFKHKQNDFLLAHWKKTAVGKKYKTNGFRFDEGLPWDAVATIYSPKEQCLQCDDFITVVYLSGEPDHRTQACAKPDCARKTYRQPAQERSVPYIDVRAIRRDFYYERLTTEMGKRRFAVVSEAGDEESLRTSRFVLMALAGSDYTVRDWFQKKYAPDNKDVSYRDADRWALIQAMPPDMVQAAIVETVSVSIASSGDTAMQSIGKEFGITIRDWTISASYLNKKDEKGLRALAKELNILADANVQAYIEKQLGKAKGQWPSGKLEKLDKKQLKSLFLESGLDLKGKVPKEILGDKALQDELDEAANE